jgi:two-component system response regulator RegX3
MGRVGGHLADAGRGVAGDGAPSVLLIEDDPTIAELIEFELTREGLHIAVATDGEQGVECFRRYRPRLVLLDLMLPGMSGFEVCRILRAESDAVAIVILSARVSEVDRVAGLGVGADDYITKPFAMCELVARVHANLRRYERLAVSVEMPVLRGGPVELDVASHEVRIRGHPVDLPRKEFDLLETFLRAPGRLRSRSYLLDQVWGAAFFGDPRTLDVHVKRLRCRIERDPHQPEHLLTVRGLGYRFVPESERVVAVAAPDVAVR